MCQNASPRHGELRAATNKRGIQREAKSSDCHQPWLRRSEHVAGSVEVPMANVSGIYLGCCNLFRLSAEGKRRYHSKAMQMSLGLLAVAALLGVLVFAQGAPRVTSVEPTSGKANGNVTLMGENLGKGSVPRYSFPTTRTITWPRLLIKRQRGLS